MSYLTTKDDLAKIAIAKNLIKEYKNSNSERTVYLNDGTEFQIYLKNPYQTHLGIRIYVNNQSIGNMLVLKPGQSFWLDRFVNENKRFLFSTYQVENSAEMKYAIDKNGWVKIEFYHERENKPFQYNPGSITWIHGNACGDNYNLFSSTTGSASNVKSVNTVLNTTTCYYDASSAITASSACTDRYEGEASADTLDLDINANRSLHKHSKKSIETGRVEKGSRSNQEFEYCDIDFEYYPFKTENILILPVSRKQIRVEETRRRYCSQCGKKVSPKDKFCSNCGAKLN
jgi:hypothetical protein